MEQKDIIKQRRVYLEVLESARDTLARYNSDFEYIKNADKLITKVKNKYSMTFIKLLVFGGLAFLIGGVCELIDFFNVSYLFMIGFVFFQIKEEKKGKKEVEKILNNVEMTFKKIQEVHENYEYKESLHIKYFSPDICNKLYEYISEGRADSLKESINLMHSEAHKQKMLKKQEDIYSNLNSASKKNVAIGVATVAAILFSGSRD